MTHRNQVRGTTLVDVSASIALLVVGVLSLAHVSLTIRSLTRTDEEKSIAAAALQEELHAIESTPFREIVARHDGRGFAVFLEGAATPALRALASDVDGLPGLVEVVAADPPNDAELLLEATVTLEWEGSCGPRRLLRRIRIARSGASP